MRIFSAAGIQGTYRHERIVQRYIRQRSAALGVPPSIRVAAVCRARNHSAIACDVYDLTDLGYFCPAAYSSFPDSPEDAEAALLDELRRVIDHYAPDYAILSNNTLSVPDICAELIRYWSEWPERQPGFDGQAALTLAELEAA
jgi:hypothetical protein